MYGAYVRGEEDPLPELAVQYADYAVWQRKWMEGEVLRAAGGVLEEERWRECRSCWSCRRTMRGRRSRTMPGGTVAVVLDEELTAGLKAAEPAAWDDACI